MQRLHAFMEATHAPDWEIVRDEDTPRMLEHPAWKRARGRAGARKEIFDKNVPLTLSTESLAMWNDLGPTLGVGPATYTCGCGPCAVPSLKRISDNPRAVALHNLPEGQA